MALAHTTAPPVVGDSSQRDVQPPFSLHFPGSRIPNPHPHPSHTHNRVSRSPKTTRHLFLFLLLFCYTFTPLPPLPHPLPPSPPKRHMGLPPVQGKSHPSIGTVMRDIPGAGRSEADRQLDFRSPVLLPSPSVSLPATISLSLPPCHHLPQSPPSTLHASTRTVKSGRVFHPPFEVRNLREATTDCLEGSAS